MRRRFMISNTSDITNNYLTIEALENGLTAQLSINACEYCVNGNGVWKSLPANTATESINTGQTLSFRGALIPQEGSGIGTFSVSKKFKIKGDCMSLLYGDDAPNLYTLTLDYAFRNLFKSCNKLEECDKNILKANVLTAHCYEGMFLGCTSLTAAPELPATTLAEYCYYNMFYYCIGLTTIPELPATTLAEYCYSLMFRECTSLTTIPELPATTLAGYCYDNMFRGCTSLTTALKLPATTLAEYCYYRMFEDCTSLTTAPELPATNLAQGCYQSMFEDCTSLTTAPDLLATSIAMRCYDTMFYNCTNLNFIRAYFQVKPSSQFTDDWVYGVASKGTFVKSANASWSVTGVDAIPSGWKVIKE